MEASEKIVAITTEFARDGRASGMLNSPPGSGKSALFQFAEQFIPTKYPDIAVMALTFNHKSNGDRGKRYTPEEGLVLRVAYYCAPQQFFNFRELWMSKPELKSLSLFRLLALTVAPFAKTQ